MFNINAIHQIVSLTLFILMDHTIHIDTIRMEWSMLYFKFVCLFDLIFYVPVNNFSVMSLVLFGLVLYVPVNSYGHVRTVSSPNHTFFLDKLD